MDLSLTFVSLPFSSLDDLSVIEVDGLLIVDDGLQK